MTVAFVQAKTAAGGTVTLDNPTGAGNCLAVLISGWVSSGTPAVSAVKLGGAADNFAATGVSASNPTVPAVTTAWLDLNCAGGQTSVTVTMSTGSAGAVTVIEFSGVATSSALDKSSAAPNNTGATSWSSGATATTTVADEAWVGLVTAQTGSTPTVTGPASPWVHQPAVSFVAGSQRVTSRAGYQNRAST